MLLNKILLPVKSKFYNSPLREKFYKANARLRLRNKNFTILSNNCWAWSVYEDVGLPYDTPTIGLYFFANCYLKFLQRLEYYLQCKLEFKRDSLYDEGNRRIAFSDFIYPIGKLDDLEIHFFHYKTEEEAFQKWNKRVQRIHFDNLFIAGSDKDLCTPEHIRQFDALPYKNKVFFSAKNYPELKSVVWLQSFAGQGSIGDIATHRWPCRKYFDVVKWLNCRK